MNITARTTGSGKIDQPRGALRVEDCELRFKNGEMSVTFRLALPTTTPTARRVPPRPSKSKP